MKRLSKNPFEIRKQSSTRFIVYRYGRAVLIANSRLNAHRYIKEKLNAEA